MNKAISIFPTVLLLSGMVVSPVLGNSEPNTVTTTTFFSPFYSQHSAQYTDGLGRTIQTQQQLSDVLDIAQDVNKAFHESSIFFDNDCYLIIQTIRN